MQTVILAILDGIGLGRQDEGDAVYLAHTPNLDQLMQHHPWGKLQAHGRAVGLPSDGDMGNSEVGHNAMGAGRVFDQGAKLVNQAIESGSIWQSYGWQEAIKGKTLHLLGLLSDGNVHSHINHLFALLDQAKKAELSDVCVHILTDGRDVHPTSALHYIQQLEEKLSVLGSGYRIATGGGRMQITMDRYEADWEMVQRGWDCHVHAKGRQFNSAQEAIETFYQEDPNRNDQWLPAFVINGYTGMNEGDSVILFNFRGDRAVEISRAFSTEELPELNRGLAPALFFAGMMEYDGDLKVPAHHLVPPPAISDTVGDRLSAAGKRVLAISETQKFGHVTFFFNGNRSEPLNGETQREIPSAQLPFNQRPKMSAAEITEIVCTELQTGHWDHIRLNLANGDMVGHTGDKAATIIAVEEVDRCVGLIMSAAEQAGSILIVTADHGNADEVFQWDKKKSCYKKDSDGNVTPSTAHSLNPVPFCLFDPTNSWCLRGEKASALGGLAQIGGTLLELNHLPVPEHYLPSLVKPAH